MFQIQSTVYGYKLTFEGFIQLPEMTKFHQESVTTLKTAKRGYNVLIDMSKMSVLPPDSRAELEKAQKLWARMGMGRSAVLCPNVTVTMQLKKVAADSGINSNERYLTATEPNALGRAEAWLTKGTEPK